VELIGQKPPEGAKWLALGDFNQIGRARDKNKGNVNRNRINRFRADLQTWELNENASLGLMKETNPLFASSMLSIAMPSGTFDLTFTSSMPCLCPYLTISLFSSPTIVALVGQGPSSLRTFGYDFPVLTKRYMRLGTPPPPMLSLDKSSSTSCGTPARSYRNGAGALLKHHLHLPQVPQVGADSKNEASKGE
jgi:hypothetical protein